MDFTAMTGAVDATTIVAALLAIGAVLILPKATAWGVRTVKGLVR
jgi:hypothetical protein